MEETNVFTKNSYKRYRCMFCKCRPDDMGDLTMGEFCPKNKNWACFDHTDKLWKQHDPNITTQREYWDKCNRYQ